MNNQNIDDILKHLTHGERCTCGFEDDEFSTVISIEQNPDGSYTYKSGINHKYDVIFPTRYDSWNYDEMELRSVLRELPDDVFQTFSYTYKDIINEKTREKVELIYSYLRQAPKTIYVVFREEDQRQTKNIPLMKFNGLFKSHESAEQNVQYLRSKLGIKSYWKEVSLSLQDGQMVLHGNFSEQDSVNSNQILVTLLDMDTNRLTRFLES